MTGVTFSILHLHLQMGDYDDDIENDKFTFQASSQANTPSGRGVIRRPVTVRGMAATHIRIPTPSLVLSMGRDNLIMILILAFRGLFS